MLSNFSWMSFFIGIVFAMFVWPFVMNMFTKMTASVTTGKAAS